MVIPVTNRCYYIHSSSCSIQSVKYLPASNSFSSQNFAISGTDISSIQGTLHENGWTTDEASGTTCVLALFVVLVSMVLAQASLVASTVLAFIVDTLYY